MFDFAGLTTRQHVVIACGGVFAGAQDKWPTSSVALPLINCGWLKWQAECFVVPAEVRADWLAQRVAAFEAESVPAGA